MRAGWRIMAVLLLFAAALGQGLFNSGPRPAPTAPAASAVEMDEDEEAEQLSRDPVVLDRADRMRAVEINGRTVRELEGNVRVFHHGRTFTFSLGRYNQDTGLMTCVGNVKVVEGRRVLTADEVTYDERRETVLARGHVHAWDDSLETWAEKGTWYNGLKQGDLQIQARLWDKARKVELRAGNVQVDHEKGVYIATRSPVLTLLEKPPTTLSARVIEWRRADSLAMALHGVNLVREDFRATCDSMLWRDRIGRMEFYLSPVLTRGDRTVSGDWIHALLQDRRVLDSLWVEGSARMESPSDSVSVKLRDVLQGRRFEMDFTEGRLESVFVEGSARSVFFLKDESGRPGMNVADADRIWLQLKDQRLETVLMGGGMEARWVPLVEPPGAHAFMGPPAPY